MNRNLRHVRSLSSPGRKKIAQSNKRLLHDAVGEPFKQTGLAGYQNSCGKVAYATKKEAQTVLNERMAQRHGPERLRIYACEYCGFWHLTKKDRKG